MLDETMRNELKSYLHDIRRDGMFGDGLESDYIMDGCTIVGLNQMTDEQLVEEYESSVSEDDEFLGKLKIVMSIDKKLRE